MANDPWTQPDKNPINLNAKLRISDIYSEYNAETFSSYESSDDLW